MAEEKVTNPELAEVKAKFAALTGEFQKLDAAYAKLTDEHSELLAQQEVLKAQLPKPDAFTVAGLPPVGSHVTFVNHGGVHEKAIVTGHGHLGVHIDVQGIHKNDKYSRKEVPVGGPDKTLTVF